MLDDAYDVLRAAIIDGRLQPSERLVEADISTRFDLKPSAVRKALIRLEHDGIVVRERYRGARVRRFTEREVEQILEANAALKAVAIRQAARDATSAQIEQLEAMLAELSRLVDEDRLLEAADVTADLHHQILEMSGNDVILRLCGTLSAQMARFMYQTVLAPGGSAQVWELHRDIVQAIVNRDEESAVEALRRHFAYSTQALRAYTRRAPDRRAA